MTNDEWRSHLTLKLDAIDEKITNVRIDVAMLKVKSGIWGILGGFIPVVIMIIVEAYKK